MKAISLWQPWASLITGGAKKIETRSWPYVGPLPVWLAIHATCTIEPRVKAMLLETRQGRQIRDWLETLCGIRSIEALPLGSVVAVARLAACKPTGTLEETHPLSEMERALGDYRGGRFAWILDRVEFLDRPLPARGAQGLWTWEEPADVKALMAS